MGRCRRWTSLLGAKITLTDRQHLTPLIAWRVADTESAVYDSIARKYQRAGEGSRVGVVLWEPGGLPPQSEIS